MNQINRETDNNTKETLNCDIDQENKTEIIINDIERNDYSLYLAIEEDDREKSESSDEVSDVEEEVKGEGVDEVKN